MTSPVTVTAPPKSPLPRPSAVSPTPVAELAALAGADLLPSGAPNVVAGVNLRAQAVRPGDLFAALPSVASGRHGADFADVAVAAGAAAVLTDPAGAARAASGAVAVPMLVHPDPRAVLGPLSSRIYGHPSTKVAVLGITGTSGKTTTTYLLEAGLRAAGLRTGLLGTVGAHIDGEQLATGFTTPEAPDLQALLAVLAERGVTHLAMEVSSHALALGRVAGTEFAVGAFTNLSPEHLDFHADMQDYFEAKAALFDGRSRRAVVCVDDEWGRRLVEWDTVTVSLAGEATWRAADRTVDRAGAQLFRAVGPEGIDLPVRLRLPGAFNVTNALLAIACGYAAGVDPEPLARGIGAATVPGRMEPVDRGQPFLALVDYAHKPAAVSALLHAVRAQTAGRILTVLGCGGDRDTAKRPIMGAEAARLSDVLIVTDDNPRSEDPAAIRAAMLDGARSVPHGDLREIGDRAEAIAAAVAAARPGDAVVVAGKGHETGQDTGGVVRPFSDVEELGAALERILR